MPRFQFPVAFCCIAACSLLPFHAQAAEKSAPPADMPSVQQQLDELKQGQQRLLREMEELKALLREKTNQAGSTNEDSSPKITSVNVYREPFRGTNTAKVAIVEYSDFNCSFCGRYARNIFPHVDADYIETGKVRYFFRDLPEPNETNAWLKARAARCAGDQDKFWEMHDRLFAAQEISGPDLPAVAQSLGLDLEKFNQCFSAQKYLINIQRSVAGARQMGIYGTPAFLIGTMSEDGGFVNVKKLLVGAESYDAIRSVLEELLNSLQKN